MRLICGDSLKVIPTLKENSVDACLTDPPYGLEFMGKDWDDPKQLGKYWDDRGEAGSDSYVKRRANLPNINPSIPLMKVYQSWCFKWSKELFRVLKPGAYLLCFGGTRTSHRLASGIEDAGFIIRDTIDWVYWSGFPKSMDVSKAFDKKAGLERPITGLKKLNPRDKKVYFPASQKATHGIYGSFEGGVHSQMETSPVCDLAKKWAGYGTSLKPSHEPIVVAQKPLEGTYTENLVKWGVGALNIDACRIPYRDEKDKAAAQAKHESVVGLDTPRANVYNWRTFDGKRNLSFDDRGRFPSNLVEAEEEEAYLGTLKNDPKKMVGQGYASITRKGKVEEYRPKDYYEDQDGVQYSPHQLGRFPANLYGCPKASRRERRDSNDHPTVKPIKLLEWLLKLVSRPKQTVIDPFLGSGSMAVASHNVGRDWIGIEISKDYCEIARRRFNPFTPIEIEDLP